MVYEHTPVPVLVRPEAPPRDVIQYAAVVALTIYWVATAVFPPLNRAMVAGSRRVRFFGPDAPGVRAFALPLNLGLHALGEGRGGGQVVVSQTTGGREIAFLGQELQLETKRRRTAAIERNLSRFEAALRWMQDEGVERIVLAVIPPKTLIASRDPAVVPALSAALLRMEVSERNLVEARAARGQPPFDGAGTREVARRVEGVARRFPQVSVADITAALFDTSESDPTYELWGSHWTARGAAQGAAATLEAWLGQRPEVMATGRRVAEPLEMWRALGLPALSHLVPDLAQHPLYRLGRLEGVSCPTDLYLVGTSMSLNQGTFLRAIETASGCAVKNLARPAQTPGAGLRLLGRQARLRGATVIWEMPLRFFGSTDAFAGFREGARASESE
jgi:hypothetical protein